MSYDSGDEWRRERPDIYGYKDGKMDIEREQVRGTLEQLVYYEVWCECMTTLRQVGDNS